MRIEGLKCCKKGKDLLGEGKCGYAAVANMLG